MSAAPHRCDRRRREWLAAAVLVVALLFPTTLPALDGGAPPTIDGVKVVGFRQLSAFRYEPPEADAPLPPVPYPPDVVALNGQRVAIRGYLLPIEFDPSGIVAFYLTARPDLGCCFGTGLALNEWVEVRWKGKPITDFEMERPMTVIGTLTVAPQISEGSLVSLYLLEGTALREDVR